MRGQERSHRVFTHETVQERSGECACNGNIRTNSHTSESGSPAIDQRHTRPPLTCIWDRVCDLLPGQAGAAGPALANEWRDAINRALPGAPAITFRRHLLPNRGIHLAVSFPDLGAYQAFRVSWATNVDYQAVFQRAGESYDRTDELLLPDALG